MAHHPRLQLERQLFLASKVVIFSVDSTGPYILVGKGNESNVTKAVQSARKAVYTRPDSVGKQGLHRAVSTRVLRNQSRSLPYTWSGVYICIARGVQDTADAYKLKQHSIQSTVYGSLPVMANMGHTGLA